MSETKLLTHAELNAAIADFQQQYDRLNHDLESDFCSMGITACDVLSKVLPSLAALRAATLAEAVQAVDALEPPMRDSDKDDGFRAGINAALEALGRLG